MNFGGNGFVLLIIGMAMVGWIVTTAIRAKHGYPLEDDWGNPVHPIRKEDEATKTLAAENEHLKATIGKLEDRLKVLERIATDPSRQLSDDIEKLR